MGAASGQGVISQAASGAPTDSGTPQYGLGATGYTPPASAGPRPPSLTSMLFGNQPSFRRASAPRYGNQGQFSATDIADTVKNNMGNYQDTVGTFNQYGISPSDVSKAMGVQQGNLYTAMNRPDYKQYGPNGQFYQPIYQPQYTDYRNPYVGSGGFGGIMGNLGGYGMMGGMGGQSPYGQGGVFGGGFSAPSYMYAEGGEVAEDDGIAALLSK